MPGNPMSHLDSNYKPICILISGNSNIGKTTISELLQSDTTIIIHLDHMTAIMSNLNDSILSPYYSKYEPIGWYIDQFSELIESSCPEYYAQKLFDNIIEIVAKYPVVVMEGFILSMPKIRSFFMELLEKNNFIIWSLNKA